MDSINKNQTGDHHEDLSGKKAIEKMKALIDKASSCFFCTNGSNHLPFSTRPMAVQKTDEEGNIYFLSATDSRKNKEIAENATVQLLFQGAAHSDFLSVSGEAKISIDKTLIKELWSPMLKNWFTEGETDPRISVIIVNVKDGYYWDTVHGNAVAFVKQLIGAAIGKTMDDSIEGKVNP